MLIASCGQPLGSHDAEFSHCTNASYSGLYWHSWFQAGIQKTTLLLQFFTQKLLASVPCKNLSNCALLLKGYLAKCISNILTQQAMDDISILQCVLWFYGSLVPRLPRSGTRSGKPGNEANHYTRSGGLPRSQAPTLGNAKLKLCRRGEPGIFCHVESAKGREDRR